MDLIQTMKHNDTKHKNILMISILAIMMSAGLILSFLTNQTLSAIFYASELLIALVLFFILQKRFNKPHIIPFFTRYYVLQSYLYFYSTSRCKCNNFYYCTFS
ncbi:hypothetical protein SAMN04487943_101504 [Gracilibacillus orientalis]|uniref:Uncharacterized protein n=1 Tax=Gracilibacillus orientalis TaxID=334253 RepID=A0A1I4HL56_9BACI|nr:hypothetical protein SAMN04487943_101504 [Gracilibacillus orientalis]